ncbi:MAG: hypothetical protein ACI9G9_000242 [Psychromonas sp.]|jgi:hypothetical protein
MVGFEHLSKSDRTNLSQMSIVAEQFEDAIRL